ncbi:MAG: VOC family protein [Anaerolineae bacterium]
MEKQETFDSVGGRQATLHPATTVGTVTLQVADLQRSVAFYTQVVGLWNLRSGEGSVLLGAGTRPIVQLEHVPGARPQSPNTTGLYHAAIRLPDRHALAVKAAQLAAARHPFGQSDHLVSEALYLSDPDGNGLELYRDRPPETWTRGGGRIQMASEPIDLSGLLAELKPNDQALADPAMPKGTQLGHMHLRVSDLVKAEQFYHGVLGFDITARVPGALFLSAGGYHHHVALNTWQSQGGRPPSESSAGMREFSLVLPDQAELRRLVAQIQAAGVEVERGQDDALVRDPSENRIRLIVESAMLQS